MKLGRRSLTDGTENRIMAVPATHEYGRRCLRIEAFGKRMDEGVAKEVSAWIRCRSRNDIA